MNRIRQAAGSKKAGQSVGGQFARSTQTEANGAGLEPVNYADTPMHPDAPITQEGLEQLLEHFDLSHGNAEAYPEDDFLIAEAPNHATMRVDFESLYETRTMGDAMRVAAEQLDDFDPDEEFEELWSPQFGRHNGFSASEFLDGLRADKLHFQEASQRLSGASAGEGEERIQESIAHIRARALSAQITALQQQHAAAIRDELRHHIRADHPDAQYVAVIECLDGDENTYETVGVLDKDEIIVEAKSDGGQSSASNIIFSGQASDAFGFEDADGEIAEALGVEARSYRDERLLLIDLDERGAAA